MNIKRTYAGAIWTDHAIERLCERKMPQEVAALALSKPDRGEKGKNPGTMVYIKDYVKNGRDYIIQVIVKKNKKGELIVISTWVDPPFAGSVDIRKQKDWRAYKRAGFWGKVWYVLKKQLGM